ncbi:hypothetical protein PHMEG_0006652 [Phytophthora megakarya]|uniref:Uncharacterized protein n=1 Tax=Phytophthora megakarya TaxID=4795 RepID=A0A225WNC2_9STRA|nr:hypothetical protein PHMEG_0006652 [Phytophthora megakarya]
MTTMARPPLEVSSGRPLPNISMIPDSRTQEGETSSDVLPWSRNVQSWVIFRRGLSAKNAATISGKRVMSCAMCQATDHYIHW